MEWLPLEQ